MAQLSCNGIAVHPHYPQGELLCGKPTNVREFVTCYGNVKDLTKSQGSVREVFGKNLVGVNNLLLTLCLGLASL